MFFFNIRIYTGQQTNVMSGGKKKEKKKKKKE
jgi:hypothetical protein